MKIDEILDWIHLKPFKRIIRLSAIRGLLGSMVVLSSLSIIVSALILPLFFLFALFGIGPFGPHADGSTIRNIGLVLAALFGLPFVIWRSAVADRQAAVSEETLFNTKIAKAAQGLSSRKQISHRVTIEGNPTVLNEWTDDLVERIASIDTLERLAKEREGEARRVLELLSAYIRSSFPVQKGTSTENMSVRKQPRLDLQAAINSIGRLMRIDTKIDRDEWRLNLTRCDFDGVRFCDGSFYASNFSFSTFEGAVLDDGDFEGAVFVSCLMSYASAWRANLRGANLSYCINNRPIPSQGGMAASINFADLTGCTLVGANLTAIDYLGSPEELSLTYGTADTEFFWRSNMDRPNKQNLSLYMGFSRRLEKGESLTEEQVELIKEVEASGFENWSPYPASDGATGHLRAKFLRNIGMFSWPYINI